METLVLVVAITSGLCALVLVALGHFLRRADCEWWETYSGMDITVQKPETKQQRRERELREAEDRALEARVAQYKAEHALWDQRFRAAHKETPNVPVKYPQVKIIPGNPNTLANRAPGALSQLDAVNEYRRENAKLREQVMAQQREITETDRRLGDLERRRSALSGASKRLSGLSLDLSWDRNLDEWFAEVDREFERTDWNIHSKTTVRNGPPLTDPEKIRRLSNKQQR